ncbi:MAG TPA: hypothetical protein PLW83_09735, partial [Deltaproteobacteria bacterium]|nr:hypothetical protein [Deltaproteobacteria bacterium]
IYGGHLTFIHSAAVIPWVFVAMERVFEEDRPSLFGLAGAALGLLILTGNTQAIFYVTVMVCLYLPVRYVSRFGFANPRRFVAYCLWFLLVPAVSFGVSAVFLLPVAEFISLSDRAQKTFEFAVNGSFGWPLFYTLLVPQPEAGKIQTFWELGAYCSILALSLSGIGVLFFRLRQKVWVQVIMLLVSMTFVLGGYTPLYKFYYSYIPLLGNFRVPARALTVAVFFLSILAGLGTGALWAGLGRKKTVLASLSTALVITALILAGAALYDVPLVSPSMIHAYVFTALACAAVAAFALPRWRGLAVAAAVLCMFGDFSLTYEGKIPVVRESELVAKEEFENAFENATGNYRVMVPISLNPEVPLSPL